MGIALMVQYVVFVVVLLLMLDLLLAAILDRLIPGWTKAVCGWFAFLLLGVIAVSTVPGRTRHLDFVKQVILDEISFDDAGKGESKISGWLGHAITGLAVDMQVQQIQVKRHFGVLSVGYLDSEIGLRPVSVGIFGMVFRSFFINPVTFDMPSVTVDVADDSDGARQLLLANDGEVIYACTVRRAGVESPLRTFELSPGQAVRLRQEKTGFRNKIKQLIAMDPFLMTIPAPIEQDISISFKKGNRLMKTVMFRQFENGLQPYWCDPR